MKTIEQSSRIPWLLIAVFFILITCIITAGSYYYLNKDEEIKTEADSPWVMIAKVDKTEVYAPLHRADLILILESILR